MPDPFAPLTQPFADAVLEAEKIIASAPHVRTEQDLAEGYDYLAGSIQVALQLAWAYQRDFPYFIQSTGPYTKLGLDNPDTLYFHSYLRDDAEYVVTGRRGSTVDLSFQVLDGDYSPVEVPGSLTAFDDRDIEIAADGTFELRFGPPRDQPGPGYVSLGPGSAMLLVREVYGDWAAERRGTITHPACRPVRGRAACAGPQRAGEALRRGGQDPAVPAAHVPRVPRVVLPEPAGEHDDRAAADARRPGLPVLIGRALRPRRRPGDDRDRAGRGPEDRALPGHPARQPVVHLAGLHQPPDQPEHRPGAHRPGRADALRGRERDPGLANWLECTGHRRGYVQIRWQRLARDLGPEDGPQVEVVPAADLARRLPYYEQARVTPEQYAQRIAARQAAVAGRMLG